MPHQAEKDGFISRLHSFGLKRVCSFYDCIWGISTSTDGFHNVLELVKRRFHKAKSQASAPAKQATYLGIFEKLRPEWKAGRSFLKEVS